MGTKRQLFKLERLILLAFLNALIYVFLVPPWQHNDEPGNFEFAWLISNQKSYPKVSDYDPGMRRELTASLLEHSFFEKVDVNPVLLKTYEPTWIGITQINNQPLYYLLLSIPLRLFRSFDITFQLYVGRIVSVTLFLLVVFFAIKIVVMLFGNDNLLTYSTILFVSFLPGFVDKMTAVNDDVGSVAAVSFVLWMSVKFLKKGASFLTFLGLLAGLGICILTKRTALVGILAIFLAVIYGTLKNSIIRGSVFSMLLLGLLIVSSFSFSTTSPAFFYSSSNFSMPQRVRNSSLGNFSYVALQKPRTLVYQTVDRENVRYLSGKMVIFGGCFWADKDVEINMPVFIVNDQLKAGGKKILLSQSPQFFYYSSKFPEDSKKIVLSISSWDLEEKNNLYWDRLILIEDDGNGNLEDQLTCSESYQNTTLIKNYLKNGSNDQGWPILKPLVGSWIDKTFNFPIAHLWGIFDLGATWDYFYGTSAHLFRTFWGGFGWGGERLVGIKPYRVFLVFTLFIIVGNIYFLIKHKQKLDWRYIFMLGIPASVLLIMTLFRAAGNWYSYTFTPTARYFLPGIIPLSIFFGNGFVFLLGSLAQKFMQKYLLSLMAVLFLIYNIWGWYSIWRSFYQ